MASSWYHETSLYSNAVQRIKREGDSDENTFHVGQLLRMILYNYWTDGYGDIFKHLIDRSRLTPQSVKQVFFPAERRRVSVHDCKRTSHILTSCLLWVWTHHLSPCGCRSCVLLTSCMRLLPLCEVMTLRSGLRLLTIWGPGEGEDLARTTFPRLLPLDTERRPGEALALM